MKAQRRGHGRRRGLVGVAAVLALTLLAALAQGAAALTIAKTDDDLSDQVAQAVLAEAYRRIGVPVQFKSLPQARTAEAAADGQADGELQRRLGLETSYPALLPVKVPINRVDWAVFTVSKRFRPNGWSSLKPYHIGIVHGSLLSEEHTEGMQVESFGSVAQALQNLKAHRIDITVLTRLDALAQLVKWHDHTVRLLEPPIASAELYHYLNRSHAELVPKLEGALRRMQEEGAIERIRKRVVHDAMHPYLTPPAHKDGSAPGHKPYKGIHLG